MNVLKREKVTLYVYCHHNRPDEWFIALRTPDRCLWRLKKEPFSTRAEAEKEALLRASFVEEETIMQTEIRFEVPRIDPSAVPVADFKPSPRVLS